MTAASTASAASAAPPIECAAHEVDREQLLVPEAGRKIDQRPRRVDEPRPAPIAARAAQILPMVCPKLGAPSRCLSRR